MNGHLELNLGSSSLFLSQVRSPRDKLTLGMRHSDAGEIAEFDFSLVSVQDVQDFAQ